MYTVKRIFMSFYVLLNRGAMIDFEVKSYSFSSSFHNLFTSHGDY